MRKSLLTVVIASLAVGAGLTAPALGQAAPAPTTVTINFVDRPANDVFRGTVDSPNPACRENRRVRLFFVQPGPNALIDTDRSEDNGSWSIDVEAPGAAPGRYYVKVTPRADICLGVRSSVITVG